jgi:hypothetical protein
LTVKRKTRISTLDDPQSLNWYAAPGWEKTDEPPRIRQPRIYRMRSACAAMLAVIL